MDALRLDRDGIIEYQANRFPYLMIDFADEVIPGISARGYRQLTDEDWFFKCHFPGDPNMPGLLQIEALVQMSALAIVTLPGNKGTVCYLTSADALKLKRKILPGDRLDIETRVISFKRGIAKCEGRGLVQGTLACEASFTIVVPHILDAFKVAR
ncbi:MAG: beta-hydroxyacyl-ACP dehydratase [Rhodospirillaceae bacterium]|nr:beta-hydroxyacyl-ACP dehydratase [Rhodospirillales bacterium]